jgi:hypothetical protein
MSEVNMDVDKLAQWADGTYDSVTGEEAWLDCLMTAIEKEAEYDPLVTELLRTAEMADVEKKPGAVASTHKPVVQFYENADVFLKILEFKARRKYYQCLQAESESRRALFNKQNMVLNEYAAELEREFSRVMSSIHDFKEKKQSMLSKLAGLLDKVEFHSDVVKGNGGEEEVQDDSHMARLTVPWLQDYSDASTRDARKGSKNAAMALEAGPGAEERQQLADAQAARNAPGAASSSGLNGS